MLKKIKESKVLSFVFIYGLYMIALAIGVLVFSFHKNGQEILFILFADIVATSIIWACSVLLGNSSVYDPYWSLAPMAILLPLSFYYGIFSIHCLLMLTAICFWGIRLTANWMIGFPNLYHQDWRYTEIRKKYPSWWQWLNFGGIHLMPTLIVFLAMLPAFYLAQIEYSANIFTYIAFVLCIASVVLQWISDEQMRRFRKEHKGKVCNTGMWKYSRHPNYLGEIIFWWSIYLMLLSVTPQYWWTGIGALINSGLFILVSIPLMEKRQLKYKPDYISYIKETPMLIPGIKTSKYDHAGTNKRPL